MLFSLQKGNALNSLGQESQALEYFIQTFEIGKSGNPGDNLTDDDITYICNTLSKESRRTKKTIMAAKSVQQLTLS